MKGKESGCIFSYNFEEVDVKGLSDIQRCVDGNLEGFNYIEWLSRYGVAVYINDEGKELNLKPSTIIVNSDGKMLDTIAGNILFLGVDEEGYDKPIPEEAIPIIKSKFEKVLIFPNIDGLVVDMAISGYKIVIA